MKIEDILIEDFDYPLPDNQIARHPLEQRDSCKLIVSDADGNVHHKRFFELPALIRHNTLMVANETRVINARIEFFKTTGSRIEIFLLEPLSPADYAVNFSSTSSCSWSCMVGNRKRWKTGSLEKELTVSTTDGTEENTILKAGLGKELNGNSWEVIFEWDNPKLTFASVVEAAGNIPIPPYLNRKSEESDTHDYQTVYSRVEGSVAAPTAGLHFTPALLDELTAKGVEIRKVTLHVGAGTFQPVKSDTIGEHAMHTESIVVDRTLIKALIRALHQHRPVLAVGTTSVRTIESLPWIGLQLKNTAQQNPQEPVTVNQWMPYQTEQDFDTIEALQVILNYLDRTDSDTLQASTSIMIAPGYRWRIVNRMITNFHQPKSTLLLLVSSFLNQDITNVPALTQWKKVYNEALKNNYRFLSYGDACLLEKVEYGK